MAVIDEPVPSIVEIAGSSMAPTLPRGAIVLVRPISRPVLPGEVVLIRGGSCWIVHRVVWVSHWHRYHRVFHRGDCEGGVGVCRPEAVRGWVLGMGGPRGFTVTSLNVMPPEFLFRFRKAAGRCLLYAAIHALAGGLPPAVCDPIRRPIARRFERRLLGPSRSQ